MLRKIKLYGPLAKFIGCRVLSADVANAAVPMIKSPPEVIRIRSVLLVRKRM